MSASGTKKKAVPSLVFDNFLRIKNSASFMIIVSERVWLDHEEPVPGETYQLRTYIVQQVVLRQHVDEAGFGHSG